MQDMSVLRQTMCGCSPVPKESGGNSNTTEQQVYQSLEGECL